MRNLLLLALLASLLITSACKKTSTNPSGTNGYGTFTLGDSTYKVYTYNYLGGGVNINPGTSNGLAINFVSPNIPPAPGSYPIGSTNAGQVNFSPYSSYYGAFNSVSSAQYLSITNQSNGYLNYSLHPIWVYLYNNHNDSLVFSMNITIPN